MEAFERAEAEKLKEIEKKNRRKLRITQVREQANDWAVKSRLKFEKSKSAQLKNLISAVTSQVTGQALQNLENIKSAHDYATSRIGEAHRAAASYAQLEKIREIEEAKNKWRAKERHSQALSRLKINSELKKEEAVFLKRRRETVRANENFKARNIVQNRPMVPKPQPPKIPEKELLKRKGYEQSIAKTLHIPPSSDKSEPSSSSASKIHKKSKKVRKRFFSKKPKSPRPKTFIKSAALPTRPRRKKKISKKHKKRGGVFKIVAAAKTRGTPLPALKKIKKHKAKKSISPHVLYYDFNTPLPPQKYKAPPNIVKKISPDGTKPSAWDAASKVSSAQEEKRKIEELKKLEIERKSVRRGELALTIEKIRRKHRDLSAQLLDIDEDDETSLPIFGDFKKMGLLGLDDTITEEEEEDFLPFSKNAAKKSAKNKLARGISDEEPIPFVDLDESFDINTSLGFHKKSSKNEGNLDKNHVEPIIVLQGPVQINEKTSPSNASNLLKLTDLQHAPGVIVLQGPVQISKKSEGENKSRENSIRTSQKWIENRPTSSKNAQNESKLSAGGVEAAKKVVSDIIKKAERANVIVQQPTQIQSANDKKKEKENDGLYLNKSGGSDEIHSSTPKNLPGAFKSGQTSPINHQKTPLSTSQKLNYSASSESKSFDEPDKTNARKNLRQKKSLSKTSRANKSETAPTTSSKNSENSTKSASDKKAKKSGGENAHSTHAASKKSDKNEKKLKKTAKDELNSDYNNSENGENIEPPLAKYLIKKYINRVLCMRPESIEALPVSLSSSSTSTPASHSNSHLVINSSALSSLVSSQTSFREEYFEGSSVLSSGNCSHEQKASYFRRESHHRSRRPLSSHPSANSSLSSNFPEINVNVFYESTMSSEGGGGGGGGSSGRRTSDEELALILAQLCSEQEEALGQQVRRVTGEEEEEEVSQRLAEAYIKAQRDKLGGGPTNRTSSSNSSISSSQKSKEMGRNAAPWTHGQGGGIRLSGEPPISKLAKEWANITIDPPPPSPD